MNDEQLKRALIRYAKARAALAAAEEDLHCGVAARLCRQELRSRQSPPAVQMAP